MLPKRLAEFKMMRTYYNIVYFIPQPPLGSSFAVGAFIVSNNTRKIKWVEAERLPTKECLGSSASLSLLEWMLIDFANPEQFETLKEGSLGPHVWIRPSLECPVDDDEALSWVKTYILPNKQCT